MTFHDTMTTGCTDPALQEAFRTYYAELGCRVTNWPGLFEEITDSGDLFLVRRNDEGGPIGFLLLAVTDAATAWRGFFTTKLGCVEEFWVDAAYRSQGHGSALLRKAEAHFRAEGCGYAILTTDTAPDFYRSRGYLLQRGIKALNKADVYVKPLR